MPTGRSVPFRPVRRVFLLQFALLSWLVGTPGRSDFPRRLDLDQHPHPPVGHCRRHGSQARAPGPHRPRAGGDGVQRERALGCQAVQPRRRPRPVGPLLGLHDLAADACGASTAPASRRTCWAARSPPTSWPGSRSRVAFGVIESRLPGAFLAAGGVARVVLRPGLLQLRDAADDRIRRRDAGGAAWRARWSVFEGLFGVVFTTIVMASLVAGYLRHRERDA